MSTNAIELALWRVSVDGDAARQLADDPDEFLGRFRLDEGERRMLREWDVAEMGRRDVNWMVMMFAFQAVHGRQETPEYMRRLNAPRGAAEN